MGSTLNKLEIPAGMTKWLEASGSEVVDTLLEEDET
jgi:hypothetical protein